MKREGERAGLLARWQHRFPQLSANAVVVLGVTCRVYAETAGLMQAMDANTDTVVDSLMELLANGHAILVEGTQDGKPCYRIKITDEGRAAIAEAGAMP